MTRGASTGGAPSGATDDRQGFIRLRCPNCGAEIELLPGCWAWCSCSPRGGTLMERADDTEESTT